ncbi:hypothetical protein [Maribacter ulvicola]|uniref:Uncharacterized protein n=1 Tax=Maribacter ulvicola TaxID=228959 RepID=A0A1N6XQ74_9FLAO|nr:hypothetical protein [Maribacter ulvicola]SIR04525.1 hypothetical protein SAMN05421797_105212 [Maribacter ulvicola]
MRIFNETQRFTQWWLLLLNVALLFLIAYSCYTWFILGDAVGNIASNDLIGQTTFLLIFILIIPLIYVFNLKTTIDEIGIHYQFIPIHFSKKIIRWHEIEKCFVRTYSPIRAYGGWGYRGISGKNKALNVKGNKGIQLILKNGKKLLIGTQKEREAKIVIERYFKITNE